jgi:hypothetical protein
MSAQPKFNYFRSASHLKAVRDLGCIYCGAFPAQAAHSNSSKHGKGAGIKASDIWVIPLCLKHHAEFDQSKNTRATNERWFMDKHNQTIGALKMFGTLSKKAIEALGP